MEEEFLDRLAVGFATVGIHKARKRQTTDRSMELGGAHAYFIRDRGERSLFLFEEQLCQGVNIQGFCDHNPYAIREWRIFKDDIYLKCKNDKRCRIFDFYNDGFWKVRKGKVRSERLGRGSQLKSRWIRRGRLSPISHPR